METFYSTHAIEQLRGAFIPLLRKAAPDDAAFVYALTEDLERSIKFRLPDAGDLLGIDRRSRTFEREELDVLHMPYPVTALEYTFAGAKQTISNEHRFVSAKRITLVHDIPAGAARGHIYYEALKLIPGFQDQGGVVITGYWSNTEDGDQPASGQFRCDWENAACAIFIPRNQDPDLFGPVAPNIHPVKKGDLHVYFALTVPIIYKAMQSRMAKDVATRTMLADLVDDLHIAFDFMLALSCNNVEVAPAAGESRVKLNKKRLANKKPPFFEYKQLMIAGGMLDATQTPGERPRTVDGGRAPPRLHLRRGHIRRIPGVGRRWINFAVVGAAIKGQVSKDYVVKGPAN